MATTLKPKLQFQHVFTTTIPSKLENNTLYISIPYNTVLHKCACGCGEEVSTPLSPTDWKLTYNGESVTLYPSIGNWSYKCRSHYWIREDRIEWADDWSEKQIIESRKLDEQIKKQHRADAENKITIEKNQKKKGLKQFLKDLFK
ncbi:DUF6527 family protein [Psychrobacillus sp. FSL H8-0484]|uniref:DUF6527 family protein n=1 Tax=unclassified Psychrobacillus TaxID=2636677 RepID=UPI0030F59EA7